MPRALLLKKPKFNEEGDENNDETQTHSVFSETKTSITNENNDEINTVEKNSLAKKGDKIHSSADTVIRADTKCGANQIKRKKKQVRGHKPRKKIKVEIKADSGIKGSAKKTPLRKKRDSIAKVKDLSKENDLYMQDKIETCTSQQHFVKWMKKDGKTFKIWECGICHKEFMHQYTLMRHLPIHTDERNFKCDICQKAFRQASTLCRHKAIHSDARPFPCIVCGKAFNRSSTLIAHRKTHSEYKPYSCHVCGKGFHQKGNLKNHIYTHTGERPYKCDKCERGFNQMSNLMCHKAHAHVEKPKHTCHLCGKEFPRKFSLRSHEEYKHGIKYDITGEQPLDVNANKYKELMEQRLKLGRPTNRNFSKTITLPNGDKTIKFVNKILNHEAQSNNFIKLPNETAIETEEMGPTIAEEITEILTVNTSTKTVPQSNIPLSPNSDSLSRTTGILIDPINTPAMLTTMQNGQMPFALLKPAKGIPVLVKILPTTDGKQVLVPATAEDLRSAGKITVSPLLGQTNGTTIKAVQIKVPVVATVSQKLSSTGQLIIEIEAVECLQETNDEIIDQQINTLMEEQVPCNVEESVISMAEVNINELQNTLLLTNSDNKVPSGLSEGISSISQTQNNQTLQLVAEDSQGIHLSCADALATLSVAAVNMEKQELQSLSLRKLPQSSGEITLESAPTEVIQNVIENITKLNNLTAN